MSERLGNRVRELPYGCGGEDHLGARDGRCDIGCLLVDGTDPPRGCESCGIGVIATHMRSPTSARGQANGSADQPYPENRHPHDHAALGARFHAALSTFPARAAARSTAAA